MTEVQDERTAVVEWFETEFKDAARATTKTSRLEDGKLSYSFSVVNNSGYDFSRFSFRIKVINKADNSEIGTASIRAGEWANGDKKNFKSKFAIPADAKSLSFVMYSNSLDYDFKIDDDMKDTIREVSDSVQQMTDAVKGIGGAITGSDGSGGMFGELFGTGGMPETQTAGQRPAAQNTAAQRSAGTSARRGSTGTVDARPAGSAAGRNAQPNPAPTYGSFTRRRNEKKLNKMRLGKSAWHVAGVVSGIIFLIAAAGSPEDPQFMMQCGILGAAILAATGISKLIKSSKAKRIRAYEARVNQNGNTSLDDLAAYVGKPVEKVADELQQMIVDGFFGEAYIDMDNRLLVMTRNGVPIVPVEETVAKNKKERIRKARDKGVLPESIDDLITMTDDAEIKAKLKALGIITKQIDARAKEVPELEKQVSEFRDRFYPELVRLTDEYNEKIADMGSTGSGQKPEVSESSSGAPVINANPNYLEEQAADIKKQLISLIDSVTEASENLLERMHEDDIMDITTDIKKLQTTLASKGLLDSDFDIK